MQPRRRDRAACAVLVGLLALPLPAAANDSTAAIGLGGIVLLKQADIAMDAEELDIAPDAVRVHYRFRNHSAQDIETTVAFPLPKFNRGEPFYHDLAWPNPGSGNLVDFTVTVDGAPVQPNAETRAFVRGKDVTKRLRDLGAPLGEGVMPKLSPDLAASLTRAGFLKPADADDVVPTWDEQTTFYWPQRFPAGSEVTAEHRYRPAAGLQHIVDETELGKFCFDDQTKADIRRLAALDRKNTPSNDGYFAELATVRYILTTARNWRGPIGDFALTVSSPHPDIMVSSCFPGLRRTSGTSLAMHARSFVPNRELAVYFVIPHSAFDPATLRPKPADQLIADSALRAITPADLQPHTAAFLALARNEIFARHGKQFRDPWVRAWFSAKAWYRPGVAESALSPLEQANVETILREEAQRTASGGHR